MKKLLLVFAHPDDESFAVGGTAAKYVKSGWQVDLICATKGEAGSAGPYNVSGSALGVIRAGELKASADILGISHTTFLGHTDGRLSELTPGTLEDPIFREMESEIPDVVITFDQTGISNHPDHIKLCYATTFAFQKYAVWLDGLQKKFRVQSSYEEAWLKRLEGMISKRIEPKLYYVCMPRSFVRHLVEVRIIPNESFGKPWDGVRDAQITTVIDIREFSRIKLQALKTHETQISDVERFVQVEGNPLFDQEYFMLRMQGKKEHFMGKNDRISDRL